MSPATANKLWFKTPADIAKRRNKLGLTQADFWAPVGISQSGGSRYESARNFPAPVMLLLQVAYGTEHQARTMVSQIREPASSTECR